MRCAAQSNSAVTRPMIMTDWRERNRTFFDALKVERNVMFIILTLIVLVAALNIISGLIMLVKDKSHDIAVLRTMGATRGGVMRDLPHHRRLDRRRRDLRRLSARPPAGQQCRGRFASFSNGSLNANLFPAEIYFLSQVPSSVDPTRCPGRRLMTLALSVLATIYPSWRAAKLDPVEALRYE